MVIRQAFDSEGEYERMNEALSLAKGKELGTSRISYWKSLEVSATIRDFH
jgi:hypothetical protein